MTLEVSLFALLIARQVINWKCTEEGVQSDTYRRNSLRSHEKTKRVACALEPLGGAFLEGGCDVIPQSASPQNTKPMPPNTKPMPPNTPQSNTATEIQQRQRSPHRGEDRGP